MKQEANSKPPIIQFKGIINQSFIAHVVDVIDDYVPLDLNSRSLHRKLLSISVELLQNIAHHGIYDTSDHTHGKFEIYESDDHFEIVASNRGTTESCSRAKEAIAFGKSLTRAELIEHTHKRASIESEESAGIGLFTILASCSNQVSCSCADSNTSIMIEIKCRLNKIETE
ncbi:MAG: DUF6272 family protein [Bacteroidia bacterium]